MSRQKLLIGTLLLGCSCAVLAFPKIPYKPGFYIGVQAGYGRISKDNALKSAANYIANWGGTQSTKTITHNGIGGRAYLGFSLNRYLSAEGGFSYYPENSYKASSYNPTSGQYARMNTHLKTYAWDLMGKLFLPLPAISPTNHSWGLFAKLGIAYVSSRVSGTIPGTTGKTNSELTPAYGVGVNYNISKHLAADAAWTGFVGQRSINFSPTPGVTIPNNFVPSGNLFTLGLLWKVTNLF